MGSPNYKDNYMECASLASVGETIQNSENTSKVTALAELLGTTKVTALAELIGTIHI
jgi:hypothetical protein